jgi:hypothetical protein
LANLISWARDLFLPLAQRARALQNLDRILNVARAVVFESLSMPGTKVSAPKRPTP